MPDQIAIALKPLITPIDKLVVDPSNARKHSEKNIEVIKGSLRRFGQRTPIVVQKRGMVVRAGNARLMAAKSLGWKEIAALVVDESDIDAAAYAIADNRSSELGEWDDEALVSAIESIRKEDPDLLGSIGFGDKEISSILDSVIGGSGEEPPMPDVPKNPVTKTGDVIDLGNHRLLCGDCQDKKLIDAFMNGQMADLIFTDPPWNVAIGQNSNPGRRQREGLRNDDLGDEFSGFLNNFCQSTLPHLNGDIYCVMGCCEWPTIDKAFRDAGIHWSSTIVWVKDQFILGRSQYHSRFEPIWYGWPENRKSTFNGKRDQDDVWEFDRPKVSDEHPTMKPVALVERAILNSSSRGGVVFDPFLGSGTTLLASENTERKCVGVEISPAFCDVIVERWETLTGKKTKRHKGLVTA